VPDAGGGTTAKHLAFLRGMRGATRGKTILLSPVEEGVEKSLREGRKKGRVRTRSDVLRTALRDRMVTA